jgi:anti-sigma-K factor RskA
MTSHDELLDSVAAYALGALSPAEAEIVAKHLQSCEECLEEYRFLRPAVTAVAYGAEVSADARSSATAATPLLKERVMKRVRAESARRLRMGGRTAYAAAAACLAIAIVTAAADLSLNQRLGRERALASAQAQIIADLSAPDSQRRAFAGGEVVTREARLYIAMYGLAEPPPNHVYQAWTLAKGAKSVAPSVTFKPSPGGVSVVRLPQNATDLAAVAVSVEPDGGSKQPTTKPIALVRI